VCTLTYIDKRDQSRGNHRGMGLCRMKHVERNGVMVGVEGSVKKMQDGVFCGECDGARM